MAAVIIGCFCIGFCGQKELWLGCHFWGQGAPGKVCTEHQRLHTWLWWVYTVYMRRDFHVLNVSQWYGPSLTHFNLSAQEGDSRVSCLWHKKQQLLVAPRPLRLCGSMRYTHNHDTHKNRAEGATVWQQCAVLGSNLCYCL